MSNPILVTIDARLSPRRQLQPLLSELPPTSCYKHPDVLLSVDLDGSIRGALGEGNSPYGFRPHTWQFSSSYQRCHECQHARYFLLPERCAKLDAPSETVRMEADVAVAPLFEAWKAKVAPSLVCRRFTPARTLPLIRTELVSSIKNYELNPVYKRCPVCGLERAGVPRSLSHSSFENYLGVDLILQDNLMRCREFSQTLKGFLFLVGSVGTGKTHLAVSVLRAAFGAPGWREVRFVTFADLLAMKRASYRETEEADQDPVAKVRDCGLLVLDELRLTGGRDEEPLLFDVINHRHEHFLPTVLTTNVPPAELESDLGSRTVDRIREAAFATLGFNWDSYRLTANAAYLKRARQQP